MNAAMRFELAPARRRFVVYTMLSLYFTACAAVLFASMAGAKGASSGIIVAAGGGAAIVGAFAYLLLRDLATTGKVIERQRIPRTQWKTWRNAVFKELTALYLFFGLLDAVLLRSPMSHAGWSAGFALLSMALCVGAIAALVAEAVLPLRYRRPLAAGAFLLLLLVLIKPAASPLIWVPALPAGLTFMLSIGWPVLAAVLAGSWRSNAAWADAAPQSSRTTGLLASCQRRLRRYAPIDTFQFTRSAVGTKRQVLELVVLCFQVYFWLSQLRPLRWSNGPSIQEVPILLALSAGLTFGLVGRDLHWRAFLAPGGARRGRIAGAIFAATCQMHFLFLAICALGVLALGPLLSGTPVAELIGEMADRSLAVFDIVFAISAALVVRGFFENRAMRISVFIVLCLAILVLPYYFRHTGPVRHWPEAAWPYALALVAGSYLNVRMANRLWTTEHLARGERARK